MLKTHHSGNTVITLPTVTADTLDANGATALSLNAVINLRLGTSLPGLTLDFTLTMLIIGNQDTCGVTVKFSHVDTTGPSDLADSVDIFGLPADPTGGPLDGASGIISIFVRNVKPVLSDPFGMMLTTSIDEITGVVSSGRTIGQIPSSGTTQPTERALHKRHDRQILQERHSRICTMTSVFAPIALILTNVTVEPVDIVDKFGPNRNIRSIGRTEIIGKAVATDNLPTTGFMLQDENIVASAHTVAMLTNGTDSTIGFKGTVVISARSDTNDIATMSLNSTLAAECHHRYQAHNDNLDRAPKIRLSRQNRQGQRIHSMTRRPLISVSSFSVKARKRALRHDNRCDCNFRHFRSLSRCVALRLPLHFKYAPQFAIVKKNFSDVGRPGGRPARANRTGRANRSAGTV